MSTSQPSPLLSWSPLHPPLVHFTAAQGQEAVPVDLREGAAVANLREGEEHLPVAQER